MATTASGVAAPVRGRCLPGGVVGGRLTRARACRGLVHVTASTEVTAAVTAPERTQLKVVVVTGGSKGIGASCCRVLARDGWAVAVNHRRGSRAGAESLAAEICALGGAARTFEADVAVEADVVAMFAAVDEWGQLFGLVNNAGILMGPNGSKTVADASAEDLTAILATNVLGPMLCCREAVRYMLSPTEGKDRPTEPSSRGSIVNISSGSAVIGRPLLYGMSKGALNSFQAGAVDELAALGIRINAVSPGMTNTDLVANVLPTFDFSTIPLGRVGEPEEIAEGVAFLLSDKASYVSGANLRISGGRGPGNFIG